MESKTCSTDSVALATIDSCLQHNPDKPTASSRKRTWAGATIDRHEAIASFYMNAPGLDHHVVISVTAGAARLTQQRDGRSFQGTLHTGSIIVLPAGMPCIWKGASAASLRMRIPLGLMNEAAGEIGHGQTPDICNVFHARDPFLTRLAVIFEGELQRAPHPAQKLVSQAASYALAGHMLRSYDAQARVRQRDAAGLRPAALNRVLAFMEDMCGEGLSLDELALEAGVSRFHFARAFKRSMGVTPMYYLEGVRIRQADRMLQNGCSVEEAARASGFASRRYFMRRFLLHHGQPPFVRRR